MVKDKERRLSKDKFLENIAIILFDHWICGRFRYDTIYSN